MNVERELITMTTPDGDLPEDIESRIDPGSYDMELTQRHVALEFVFGDRPFYTVAQIHAALGSGVSPDTVRSRLDELEERNVLKSEQANNGNIYWLLSEDSDWPLPPDVEVEPKQDKMTVVEWRQQLHVQVAALSVLTAIIGTAITLIGTFQAGGYYQLPINANNLLAYGLSAGLLSYFGLFLAGVLWFIELPSIDDIRQILQSK